MDSSYLIPEGKRIYAIGDIHGYADELAAMHDLIRADFDSNPIDQAEIVYIGDYIDRGPKNDEVIQMLIERELDEPDFKHVFLRGNHENAMLEFMDNPKGPRKDWLDWGGLTTIINYGVQPDMNKPLSAQAEDIAEGLREKVPNSHLEFMKNSIFTYESGGYLFVHAGIKPGIPLEKQKPSDLIMIRKGFLDYHDLHSHRIVHGHTSVKEIDVLANRINIDTGLYYGRHLTAAVLEGGDLRILTVPMLETSKRSV
ncbi:MAG: metallophosphoesterase [Pseudomonadota bacterium]